MASVARYCCCGESEPCIDCDPFVSGSESPPNSVTIAGITGAADCTDQNGTWPYSRFLTPTNMCIWEWDLKMTDEGGAVFNVFYITGPRTISGGACAKSALAGEYYVGMDNTITDDSFLEKTTGFSCDPSTGRISGTHTFAAQCKVTSCSGTVTVTVPA